MDIKIEIPNEKLSLEEFCLLFSDVKILANLHSSNEVEERDIKVSIIANQFRYRVNNYTIIDSDRVLTSSEVYSHEQVREMNLKDV